MALQSWALPQLSRLLPLDEDSLKQIITYTDTLPKDAAAEHLKNLLGDSPQALEFITSFNSHRPKPPSDAPVTRPAQNQDAHSEVPKPKPRKNKGPQLNKLPPPRRPEDYGNTAGAYVKRDEEDYMPGHSRPRKELPLANVLALQEKPDALQLPVATSASSSRAASPKPPPSAAGPLISDIKSASRSSSRTTSPAPKAKVSITGGKPMHGASTTLNDLDSAIRALELQTNPSLSSSTPQDAAKRRCNCMATRHPLLEAAPNCLNCGKIICVREGLGPCTFCAAPLLSAAETQAMLRVLKESRGKERMEANNAAHKRADVSKAPRPFSSPRPAPSSGPTSLSTTPATSDVESDGELARAQAHRDRLLAFQAQNARRTRVHDEAADFETPAAGQSAWATPAERAAQLRRQQKVLRELEWSARPEWEKRRVVASIDLKGGKIVRRMAEVERPESPQSEMEEDGVEEGGAEAGNRGAGSFSRNPLLGALIRPVARQTGKAKEREERGVTWRRVQDDNGDNEQWILDGGAYGGRTEGRVLGAEEHAQG